MWITRIRFVNYWVAAHCFDTVCKHWNSSTVFNMSQITCDNETIRALFSLTKTSRVDCSFISMTSSTSGLLFKVKQGELLFNALIWRPWYPRVFHMYYARGNYSKQKSSKGKDADKIIFYTGAEWRGDTLWFFSPIFCCALARPQKTSNLTRPSQITQASDQNPRRSFSRP